MSDTPEARILIRNNGPLRIYGVRKVVDAEGNEYTVPEGEFFSLCRCGHSSRKPFCDGSHKAAEFDAPSDAATPAG
ncbi:MAG: CDGSH iron-sulfur domain-containing protein [Chloroflexi bacterium]|nr:CDGSH iron-sulfur domain-containing protein [Chloroflexota bacterium]